MTISHSRGNRWPSIALVTSLLFIGAATLVPDWANPKPDLEVTCLRCGYLGGPDLILNVVLFIPLGIALGGLGVRALRGAGIGLVLSLSIEAAQYFMPGRSTTLRDALCNTAGAWLGTILVLRLAGWLTPSRATSARLAGATTAAVGTVALCGWLFAFLPSGAPLYGHWSPEQDHLEHWKGTVESAELDGIPVPRWLQPSPERLQREIADGFVLSIAGMWGAPTSRLGGILSVSDGSMDEVLLVGVDGPDLVVHVRRRAAVLRLRAPEDRFVGLARDAREGARLAIRVDATARGTCARVDGREGCIMTPAAGSAWILLFSDRAVTAAARILLNALTFALLALPVGMLLPGVPASQGRMAVIALAVGTSVAAPTSGLAAPTLVEWSGLAAGLVAGLVLNRLVMKVGATMATDRPA